MTTQDVEVSKTSGPEDVEFPRIGDRKNPVRQALIDFLLPSTDSVGSTTVGADQAPWRRIAGFPPLWFGLLLAVLVLATMSGSLPNTMLGGFAFTIVLGGLFIWIGNLFPYVREMGLPTILCTFGPATLVFFGVFPERGVEVTANFVAEQGFLDFFVIAVIVGSVIGMPRDLLIQAGPRFIAPLVGCIIATFGGLWLLGTVTGFGGIEAVLFIAAPIMAGGLGVGAVPMSEMYAARLGGSSADFMGDLMSAVAVANIFCILIAGGYNALGKLKHQPFPGFNGYGQLLRITKKGKDLTIPKRPDHSALSALGKGLAITSVLYVLGQYLGDVFPFLHAYAWTIIVALILNLSNMFPKELQDAATGWGDYIQSYLVPALLVGVSLTYIDIGEVLAALKNPVFIPLTIITVVLATLTSGIIGWFVKMNFIEAAITPGLVMADTGGSGDVAVLSAAQRMHLMPFAALTNRVGGVLVLFLTSVLTGFL
ncbi:2-hydroxycarboxylate transporter family protein [Corynebacterium glutamicum]|uniref:2-hydroxycarboxylate transporter family protein n=1 Tax=Corynebacterium glutamicum TaxID=1718 RepID=UPI000943FF0A|nr:2-hydroxycarboxylate transporter family protein [Corynebacterium glutamicum]OKX87062.1 ribonuclease BN [Corynebacterium glutamicum]QDX74380.1 ribonuclease BN [Corynebacterium glutamicum]QDX77139.1 ribonuclease BN [Corynebacterium glutamicum]TWS34724.1 ribonuclease BN [Corynebacterium glutamicum]TWS37738.1 ribonuclease BN [Corynebacterium glutamicum]